jgi:hypothetical protein
MLVGDVFRRGIAAGDAGIVDQDIHPAEALGELCGDDGHPFGIRDIHLHDVDGMALLFHLILALGATAGSRSAMTTRAPASARASTQASPMARAPPVTTATRPSS